MKTPIHINFMLLARANALVSSRAADRLLSESQGQFMSRIPGLHISGRNPIYTECDELLLKNYFSFIFEALREIRKTPLFNFFAAEYRFYFMSRLKEKADTGVLENLDAEFEQEARSAIIHKKSSSVIQYSDIIGMFLSGTNPENAMYGYRTSLLPEIGDDMFSSIHRKEIDTVNIKKALAGILSGAGKTDFIPGGFLPVSFFAGFSKMKKQDIISRLASAGVRHLKDSAHKEIDFIAVQESLEEDLYEFSRNSRYHLLGASPVYCYILAKKLEIRNLKILLMSKYVSMNREYILSHLFKV